MNVLPGYKVEDVLELLLKKLSEEGQPSPPKERLGLKHRISGKPLDADKTLLDNGVTSESSLEITISTSVVDPEVTKEMLKDLNDLVNELEEKSFVFIGIASYDNGHGEKSVRRQQCREQLVNWCECQAWRLTVILIDPGFKGDNRGQITEIDAKRWISDGERLGGKIKTYKGLGPTQWRLITYGTGIKEYSLISSLTDAQHIEGTAILPMFSNAIRKKALVQCCIVSGNFYAEPTPMTQYCTIGDPVILTKAGFIPSSSGFKPK